MSRELQDDEKADYLWDRSGAPDREVKALEDLLGRFAHEGRGPGGEAPLRVRRRGRGWFALLAAAAIVVSAVMVWRQEITSYFQSGGRVQLVFGDTQWEVEDNAFVASADSAVRLMDDGEPVGALTFSAGSRFRIGVLRAGLARLVLLEGRLDVEVSEDLPPRFFQVETPSALCVDLGCAYRLEVDAGGAAHVVVSEGRVAVVGERGDEHYVPAGAECRATVAAGPGTPRFADGTAGLGGLLDAFDAAAGESPIERRRLAAAVFERAAETRDTLPLWHMLGDPDEEVSVRAERALLGIAGPPEIAFRQKIVTFTRQQWREHLEPFWQ